MVATGKQAWFALMNPKSPTAPRRSPVQTRPRLLRGYRAPGGAACSRAVTAPPRPVQSAPSLQPPPPVGPLACLLQPPTHKSTAQWAQTPAQGPREIVPLGPDQPFGGGTQANTAGGGFGFRSPQGQSFRV